LQFVTLAAPVARAIQRPQFGHANDHLPEVTIRRAVKKNGFYSKAAKDERQQGRTELRELRKAIDVLLTGDKA
jgi:hypothetical protein